jgi:SAM-dependent methyltransferase
MRREGNQFICTKCGVKLAIGSAHKQVDLEIVEGSLSCPTCGREYPIRAGIPRFVPMDNYAASFGFQWNKHARTQLDSYTGLPISRDRFFATTSWPVNLQGERVLEAGCGAGRFTEVLLSTGADIYSFDYSDAVTANYSNNGANPKLHLFQGDIFDVPFPRESFDKVMCLGVLQHTPDPERALKSLAAFVRPGGQLVVDMYRAGIVARLQWKYILRPITRRMNQQRLYRLLERLVPPLIGPTRALRSLLGRAGARLSPILEYSDLGLRHDVNREWAILDTFDMYAPAHDHPQSVSTVRRWFSEAGFVDVDVRRGPNGVIGRGRRPAAGGVA